MNESNKNLDLAKKLEGLQTVDTIQKKLGIKRSTAIKIVHILRKQGLVKTSGGRAQKRLYKIASVLMPEIGNPGLYEIINKYSRIKLVEPFKHRIINNKLSVEEVIVRAIKSKSIRVILASLELFNHIKNWSLLYKYSKKYNVRRKIGALYDIARIIIKIKKMDKRIRNKLLKAKGENKFIIPYLKSKDFLDIQNEWKIYIPLNKADLEAYKEWSH